MAAERILPHTAPSEGHIFGHVMSLLVQLDGRCGFQILKRRFATLKDASLYSFRILNRGKVWTGLLYEFEHHMSLNRTGRGFM